MTEKLSDLISIEEYDTEKEKMIISYSIMSDDVLGYIYKKYKLGEIKTKHFTDGTARIVFRWLIHHYKHYKQAPKKTIGDIFRNDAKQLGEDKSEIVSDFLDNLSREYIQFQEDYVSPDFIIKEVIPQFQTKRETELLIDRLNKNLKRNDVDEINKTLSSFSKLSEDDLDDDLGTSKPGSVKEVKKYFIKDDEAQNRLFQLPGAIGQFIGPFYRGATYAFTAVEKGGKTYTMQDIGYYGVRFEKKKILDINLEMPIEQKNERFWQRALNLAIEEEYAGIRLFPIFDCENNQYGTCQVRKKKLNAKDLIRNKDDQVAWDERKTWKICDKCRNKRTRKNAHSNKRFIPAIWYKPIKIKLMNEGRLTRGIKALQPYGIGNYRIRCFPRFSANFDDIHDYILKYIEKKKFRPDIIIWDYPDITAPIDKKVMDRLNVDYNWKKIAGLAQILNCAMFVGDQASKDERNRRSLSNMCTTESKTKDAHLDMRLTLNTYGDEYDLGLQRIGMLFRRKGRCQSSEIMLTQRRETGIMIHDSEWWYSRDSHYPTIKEKNDK